MQISVWFIGATWNIFLLCGYVFAADLPMVIYIFLIKGTVLVQQALVKICQSFNNIEQILIVYHVPSTVVKIQQL